VRRDRGQLVEKIREQVQLLDVLGASFDAGNRVTGLPLATTIRVFVHDTSNSHALLAQVGELKSTTPFIDTALRDDPANLITSRFGLVLMKMTAGVEATWVPRAEVPGPPTPGALPRYVPFKSWWEDGVLRDAKGTSWSRKGIVLAIANKEGGAHIDPEQPLDVRAIEKDNSMGWTYSDPLKTDEPMSNGPLMPSIRQIAYELEHTILRALRSELAFTPSLASPFDYATAGATASTAP
jgi:hypothetical protein